MSGMPRYRKSYLLFAALFLFSVVNAASLYAEERPRKGRPALPGEPCQIESLPTWAPQEKWVWQQVCVGEIADFNKGEHYGGKLNPKIPENWPASRRLRSAFLETLLLHEPYRSALTRDGVRIMGAQFMEPVDLSGASITHKLWLVDSRFERRVDLKGLKSSSVILLSGSKFVDKLLMSNLQVEENLFMREKAEFAEVWLLDAKIGRQLDMSGSKFTGELVMAGLQVGGSLFMKDQAEFAEVRLLGAKIGRQLDMSGSKFTGELVMAGLQVGVGLFMRDQAEFAEVRLLGAKIGGQLDMTGSKFTGELVMDGLQVEGSLLMRGSEVRTSIPWLLIFAEIASNLDLSGSTLSSVDLTGTRVRGEFRLGSGKWQKDAKLTLRNTEVGALQDLPEAWPANLELGSFTYTRLGGFSRDSADILNRDVSWFKDWLGKQKPYSPQPYEHLASVFLKAGYKDKADDILFAGRERQRSEATSTWRGRAWLFLVKIFIGYGYRIYYAIYWVLGFIAIGAVMLSASKQGPANGMPYGIAYSVDMLLPIIRLRELHYEIELAGWARYYFYFHKLMGYVLASFLVAGLSGLTK
jgi:uncharacterized protein YjbI with pentapeptide repeats